MIDQELCEHLETNGYGTRGINIFAGEMPSEPTLCLSVRASIASQGGTRVLGHTGQQSELPRVQILSRAPTALEAQTRLVAIRNLLAAVVNGQIAGATYLSLEPVQPPFYLKLDANRWPVYAFNLDAERMI